MASNEVEEAVKRINSHKGVTGVLVVNYTVPIKTNMEAAETVQHAALISISRKGEGCDQAARSG